MTQRFTLSDELLSAYIDEQLDDGETLRVEKALLNEPEARQRLDDLQTVVRLLHQAPAAVPPRAFTLSEADVLAASGRAPSFWARWLPRLMPVATAVVAVLFILSIMPPMTSKEMVDAPPPQSMVVEAPAAKVIEVTKIVEKEVEKAMPQAESMAAASNDAEANPRSVLHATAAPPAAPAETNQAVALSAEPDDCDSNKASQDDATNDGMCLPDELEKDLFAPAPSTAQNNTHQVSVTWLLGGLLVVLLFLTWRITIVRHRQR
jgi:hypothetical protein